MGDVTAIGWTGRTFNPWWGCARWSAGCLHCYADTLARRWGHDSLWHLNGPRRMMSDAYWKQPAKWNRKAAAAGIPERVFCASMADVFEDHPAVTEARKRLFGTVEDTPWLTWQFLTKRIENVAGMVPWDDSWPANLHIGTSVENQRFADKRIPELLSIKGAAVRFLSCEPLLGPVLLRDWAFDACDCCDLQPGRECISEPGSRSVDWVICGGESGPGHRPMDVTWLESIVTQCQAAGVPVFVKQDSGPKPGQQGRIPDEFWIHEFPLAAAGRMAT